MKIHAVLAALAIAVIASSTNAAEVSKTYKVFILAGQSNMQGKAQNVTLNLQAEDPTTKDLYTHLRKDGKWIVRDDVFIKYGDRKGPLTIGWGSPDRTGPELEFGTMMGDHFDEPVVLVKTAFGGASLCQSFRPPSAGLPRDELLQKQLEGAQARTKSINERDKKNDPMPTMDDIKKLYGGLYREMMTDIKGVLANGETLFPAVAGRKPELAGIVWFQGWNDQYGGQDEYASNMKYFIQDVRKDLGAPNLPFVIVAMGQNGSKPAEGAMLTVRDAQMSMNDVPEFKGNLKAFQADLLVDKDAERLAEGREKHLEEWKKYGSDDGYHYYGSPIWYGRIGHSMGESMLELMKQPAK